MNYKLLVLFAIIPSLTARPINSSTVLEVFPFGPPENLTDCHIENDKEHSILVCPSNQVDGLLAESQWSLIPAAEKIFEGISHIDIGGFVNKIGQLFGSSTRQFADRDVHGGYETVQNTQTMMEVLETFFQGQIKEEAEETNDKLTDLLDVEKEERTIFYIMVGVMFSILSAILSLCCIIAFQTKK